MAARKEPAAEPSPLLAEMEAAYEVTPPGDVAVTLSRGHEITITVPTSLSAFLKLQKEGRDFIKTARERPEKWQPWCDQEPEALEQCFFVHRLMTSPKLSQVDAMRWGLKCGPLIGEIAAAILTKTREVVGKTEAAAMDDVGNASGGQGTITTDGSLTANGSGKASATGRKTTGTATGITSNSL